VRLPFLHYIFSTACLLLPIALSIGFFEKEITAMVYGIVCGSLIDFGVTSHFGFYTFRIGKRKSGLPCNTSGKRFGTPSSM